MYTLNASTSPRLRTLVLSFILALTVAVPLVHAGRSTDTPRGNGTTGMPEPQTGSLLVTYYTTYLTDHDIEEFRRNVSARYTEGTLARMVESTDVQARRASVLALGLSGSYAVNGAVARALRDSDPTVRSIADIALWSIWFRADTPENNATLDKTRALIGQERYDQAIELATRLIERSPHFAEAYNQRAIAEFFSEKFKESAEDCKKVLERNPYHTGALSGLAQCQLQLGRRDEALETLKRASKLRPFSQDLRLMIDAIEAGER
jgi:tetratricopeptide (TPR) repeat protein